MEKELGHIEIDEFKSDLLKLNLSTTKCPRKLGLLSVMLLIEFFQEFFGVVAEVKELLGCRKVKLSEIYLRVFPLIFKSFRAVLHKLFVDGEKFSGLKFFFTVAVFVVLKHISKGTEVLPKFDKMWSCIETRIQNEIVDLRKMFLYGRKSSLEEILGQLPNY